MVFSTFLCSKLTLKMVKGRLSEVVVSTYLIRKWTSQVFVIRGNLVWWISFVYLLSLLNLSQFEIKIPFCSVFIAFVCFDSLFPCSVSSLYEANTYGAVFRLMSIKADDGPFPTIIDDGRERRGGSLSTASSSVMFIAAFCLS